MFLKSCKKMSKRKRKEDPEAKATCLKEIEELNKEISRLEDELEIKERRLAENFSDESLARVIAQLRPEGSGQTLRNSRKRSNEERELSLLISRVEKLESLTGIKFVEDKAELLSPIDDNNNKTSGNAKRWRRRLSGKCFSLSFFIELETEEIFDEESLINDKEMEDQENLTVKVTKLSVEIKCPLATKELNTFIVEAEQEKDLGNTFIALEQYSKWYDCRKRTFKHFKIKYPDLVHIFDIPDKTDTVQIQNRLCNGLHFIIQWSINTDKNGNVLPQIDAFVTCSNKACGPGEKSVLQSTPEQFRKMLSRFGIEQAIECIISIVKQ